MRTTLDNIRFNCPHCGQSLKSASEFSGSNIDCPACNTTFIVFPRNRVVSPSKLPASPTEVDTTVHISSKIVKTTTMDKILVPFVLIGTILIIVFMFRYWQYTLNAIIIFTIGVTCWASISGLPWTKRNRALRRNRDFALSREQRLKLFYKGITCFLLAVAFAWPTLARLMPDIYMPDAIINPLPAAIQEPNPKDPSGDKCRLPGCNRYAKRLHFEDIPVGTRYQANAVNDPNYCPLHKEHGSAFIKLLFYPDAKDLGLMYLFWHFFFIPIIVLGALTYGVQFMHKSLAGYSDPQGRTLIISTRH